MGLLSLFFNTKYCTYIVVFELLSFIIFIILCCSNYLLTKQAVYIGTKHLKKLLDEEAQPTQLYITLIGGDKETYEKVARPLFKNSWDKVMETMPLLKQFKRSVIRITAVKDLNMNNVKGYAQIINDAQPDFIEIKGYMNIGHAMKRLKVENMQTHSEIKEFAKKLAELTRYHYAGEREESRVVLLVKDLGKDLKII